MCYCLATSTMFYLQHAEDNDLLLAEITNYPSAKDNFNSVARSNGFRKPAQNEAEALTLEHAKELKLIITNNLLKQQSSLNRCSGRMCSNDSRAAV